MKKVILYIITGCITTCLLSCRKSNTIAPVTSGVINVTNAVIGGTSITLKTNNNLISTNNTVSSNGAAWFPLASGQIQINLGVPSVAATATSGVIPAVIYYSNTLPITSASNYSLFLTGTSTSAIDNVLIEEKYNRAYTDSTCGVRFINLAPGSNPISVNIKGNVNGSEVTSLGYKSYTDFVQYSAKKTNSSYIFEFRDAASGTLLFTYTLTTPYFHNVTLALRGKVGGTIGVILDNDY